MLMWGCRLVQGNKAKSGDESLADTLLNLANYAAPAVVALGGHRVAGTFPFNVGGKILWLSLKKQLEANRQNALKSTGPRTPEGKAVVALNPIRHGLLSKEVLIASEDETALVDLAKRMRHDLAPVGELEMILVDRIISAAWRLRRVQKIESDMFDHEIDEKNLLWGKRKKENAVNLWKLFEYDFYHRDTFGKLQRYEASIERGMYKALNELRRLQAARMNRTGGHVVDVDPVE